MTWLKRIPLWNGKTTKLRLLRKESYRPSIQTVEWFDWLAEADDDDEEDEDEEGAEDNEKVEEE